MPRRALLLPMRLTVPLLPLGEVDDVEDSVLELPSVLAGADGTKVAAALERHEFAAALAAEVSEGASGLTVPLPAKLHDCELRPVS